MTYWLRSFSIALALFLSACVTINVYFPAAAAEKAADKVIDEVWGKDRPGAPPGPQGSLPSQSRPDNMLAMLLDVIIPSAQAASPDLDVSSPAVRKITASMESRHGKLAGFYASGGIGITKDGLVAVKDAGAIPLKSRGKAKQLVARENRDRKALYQAIAKANGHPEWARQIQDTFARRWVAKARKGWWYQNKSGKWVKK